MTLLSIENLTKYFGTLAVVQNVSFTVDAGEVVGLAGRNGAGRSALLKTLVGEYGADAGIIYFNNKHLQYPFNALKAGISIVHQEPELVEGMDIVSNVFLGREKGQSWFHRWLTVPKQEDMVAEASELLEQLGVRMPALHEVVRNLSGEQRQLIAIAQVMANPTKLIIVDEPTRYLSLPYQQKLLDLIQSWQQQEITVLFSSNNLDHLFAVTDRLLVFREGQLVATQRTDETTREEVVANLVGTGDRAQYTPVIWALDSYYQARKQAETLHHNQQLLEKDLAAQDTLNRQLVDQLADQVTALDKANLALQSAQRRLLTEREQERKHLARELHDQMIQDLLSLNYQLEEIEEGVAEVDTPLLAIVNDVEAVRRNIRELIEDLRRICGNLRPPTIDSLGLGAAIQSFVHDWQTRTHIQCHLTMNADFGRLPEAIELSIFRIVQEGLNNVWKHAQASRVSVSLRHTSPRMLLLTIADNGTGLAHGFDLATLSQVGHYGLLGISERVALLGGRLQVQNQADGGLQLQVEIPHPKIV